MPVPNTFANATGSIPLSQLDNNFATTITLGNTAIQLGNTVTTLNNMTFANVTIPSGAVNSVTSNAGTFTNVTISSGGVTGTRIDPRANLQSNIATLTPNIATADQWSVNAQAQTLTIAAPTGTPVDGDKLIIRIIDNGTSQTLTWNSTYTIIGTTLPTATTANKMVYIGSIYNAANTRWDVVAVTTQA